LIDRLAGLGADPAAKDASRVLRLVNTVNTKSGVGRGHNDARHSTDRA
jgi:hypothetical protein